MTYNNFFSTLTRARYLSKLFQLFANNWEAWQGNKSNFPQLTLSNFSTRSFLIFISFVSVGFVSATSFICVIIKFSASMITRSAWCLLRWRIIRSWSVTQAVAYREPHRTFLTSQLPTRHRFSRMDTTTVFCRTFHRQDLKTMTWTTTRTEWMECRRRLELRRTWNRSSRPTETSTRAGPNGMAESVIKLFRWHSSHN